MEIVLIRHGKPTGAINPKLNAQEYQQWVSNYNESTVMNTSRPLSLKAYYRDYYILSSDYQRAIDSAIIYTGKQPIEMNALYREMDIPYYILPLKLRAWTWLYFSRFCWMIGIKGNFESFCLAKKRAELAAQSLNDLTKSKARIILFGHGFMNLYIRKALMRKGWVVSDKSNQYWGETRLIK